MIFAELAAPLDEDSGNRQLAESALEALRTRHVPLVICSNSTRSEVEVIASELGIREPFIVENGGAILIPAGYFPFPIGASKREGINEVIRLGLPYAEVVAGLRRAAEASGCRIRGFYDMSVGDVAEALGIDRKQAAWAKQREWDEPFEPFAASPTAISSLLEHIEKEGLSWTREGRFYHARGRHNKGQATQIVADLYRRLYQEEIVTVGIAYGPYDLSLFERVDVPIMLRPAERRWSDAILELLQRSEASK